MVPQIVKLVRQKIAFRFQVFEGRPKRHTKKDTVNHNIETPIIYILTPLLKHPNQNKGCHNCDSLIWLIFLLKLIKEIKNPF